MKTITPLLLKPSSFLFCYFNLSKFGDGALQEVVSVLQEGPIEESLAEALVNVLQERMKEWETSSLEEVLEREGGEGGGRREGPRRVAAARELVHRVCCTLVVSQIHVFAKYIPTVLMLISLKSSGDEFFRVRGWKEPPPYFPISPLSSNPYRPFSQEVCPDDNSSFEDALEGIDGTFRTLLRNKKVLYLLHNNINIQHVNFEYTQSIIYTGW